MLVQLPSWKNQCTQVRIGFYNNDFEQMKLVIRWQKLDTIKLPKKFCTQLN